MRPRPSASLDFLYCIVHILGDIPVFRRGVLGDPILHLALSCALTYFFSFIYHNHCNTLILHSSIERINLK